MQRTEMMLLLEELTTAQVTITHCNEETGVIYNNETVAAKLAIKLNNMLLQIELTILGSSEDKEKQRIYNHFSKVLSRHTDDQYEQIGEYLVNTSQIIIDTLEYNVRFEELDEEVKMKISKFAKTQKEYYTMFLDIIKTEDDTKTPTFPYVFHSSDTNLVCILISQYVSNFFLPRDNDQSIDKLSTFINLTCDQLNIKRIDNLNQVINNTLHKIHPTQTLDELRSKLVKYLE